MTEADLKRRADETHEFDFYDLGIDGEGRVTVYLQTDTTDDGPGDPYVSYLVTEATIIGAVISDDAEQRAGEVMDRTAFDDWCSHATWVETTVAEQIDGV